MDERDGVRCEMSVVAAVCVGAARRAAGRGWRTPGRGRAQLLLAGGERRWASGRPCGGTLGVSCLADPGAAAARVVVGGRRAGAVAAGRLGVGGAGLAGVALLRRMRLTREERRTRELRARRGDHTVRDAGRRGCARGGSRVRRCCGAAHGAGGVRWRTAARYWRRRGSAGTSRAPARRRRRQRGRRGLGWTAPRAGGSAVGQGGRAVRGRDSADSKVRCVPTGTNGPTCAPSWQAPGRQR
ncbi:hypothetical protein SALBM311S_00131 [Streptomyces alboniger]